MAMQSTAELTQQGLMRRIQRMFAGDAASPQGGRERPDFWVEPTQAECPRTLDIHDAISLTDGIEMPTTGADQVEAWLSAPNAGLGGRSPSEMLAGDQRSRTILSNFIAAIEQGSFT